ncbi:MAG TPA: hypothetical protein VFO79_07070 [Xanthomonadales bacterium]|nr:hypothetical protein [Xanthomonadales bacterium]
MTTGQPLEARGLLTLGASSIAHLGDPEPGVDNQGVELPGTQVFGAVKARIGDYASFGFMYENGFDQGAKKLNSSQPDVDNGNVQGYGFSLDFSIPIDEKWRVGVGVDAMLWSCPYVSYQTTTDGNITVRDEGTDTVDQFSASLTPSFKVDTDVTLFGGITVRQHPTIEQKVMGTLLDDVEVDSGPANYIISAGIEGAVAGGAVLLSAFGYYDVSRDPAKYGPGMGVMVSLPFGRRKAQPQPPPGYPPGYQPYPGQYPGQPYPPQPYPQPYPPQPYPPQPYPPPQPPATPAPAPAPEPPPAPPGG